MVDRQKLLHPERELTEPLYSISTWDTDLQRFTPQAGLSCESINVPWRTLLRVMRELRQMGYQFGDPSVRVERTDGRLFDGTA